MFWILFIEVFIILVGWQLQTSNLYNCEILERDTVKKRIILYHQYWREECLALFLRTLWKNSQFKNTNLTNSSDLGNTIAPLRTKKRALWGTAAVSTDSVLTAFTFIHHNCGFQMARRLQPGKVTEDVIFIMPEWSTDKTTFNIMALSQCALQTVRLLHEMHPADGSVSLWISWCGQSSLVYKLEERLGRSILTDLIWIIWICYDMKTASCSYTLTPHQTYRVLEQHNG